MKTDIVVAGVGGQGILTIAFIVDHAALKHGLHFKQAEVHGMSQRGGAVQSFLRLADGPVHSDLVPLGAADLILGVEPLEALRYVDYLADDGVVVSSMSPLVNIPDYPELETVLDAIAGLRRYVLIDAERLARAAGSSRAENTVMIGAASPYLPFPDETYHELIRGLFGRKAEHLIEINSRAFDLGARAARAHTALRDAGVSSAHVRLLSRKLDFSVDPRPGADAWAAAFRGPAGAVLTAALAALPRALPGAPALAQRLAALTSPSLADVNALLAGV